MKRKTLLLTALVVCAVPALAAEPSKSEMERLKTRVTALERELANLRTATQFQKAKEDRERLLRRVDQLRDKLLAAGPKAGGKPELKELTALSGHGDAEVRGYLAAALSRLPGNLSAETLAKMTGDQDARVARSAVISLGMIGDYRAKDSVAKRAAGLELWTPVAMRHLQSAREARNFLIVACNYLHRAGDKRGVSIFMEQLDREYRRSALEEGLRSHSMSWGSALISKEVLEQADKWTGGRAKFLPPMKHGHRWWQGTSARKGAGKLLGWWKENKKGFTLPAVDAQAKVEKTQSAQPEKF